MKPSKADLKQIEEMLKSAEAEMRESGHLRVKQLSAAEAEAEDRANATASSPLLPTRLFVPVTRVNTRTDGEDGEDVDQVVNVFVQMPDYAQFAPRSSGASTLISFLLLLGMTALIWMSVLTGR